MTNKRPCVTCRRNTDGTINTLAHADDLPPGPIKTRLLHHVIVAFCETCADTSLYRARAERILEGRRIETVAIANQQSDGIMAEIWQEFEVEQHFVTEAIAKAKGETE